MKLTSKLKKILPKSSYSKNPPLGGGGLPTPPLAPLSPDEPGNSIIQNLQI